MHKHNVLKLAKRVAELPHHEGRPPYFSAPEPITRFNMNVTHCGTVACIGGVCREMFGGDTDDLVEDSVTTALEIDYGDALLLCFPNTAISYLKVTPAQAAETLRKLAATGKVNWDHVKE